MTRAIARMYEVFKVRKLARVLLDAAVAVAACVVAQESNVTARPEHHQICTFG